MNRSAFASSTTRETRSSVWRQSRETSDVMTIAQDEERGDLQALGLLDDGDDGRVDEDQRDRRRRRRRDPLPWRRAESVTATVAEVISASTPVAYAPAWASTSARKMIVTTKQTTVKISDQRPGRPGPARAPCRSVAGSAARC